MISIRSEIGNLVDDVADDGVANYETSRYRLARAIQNRKRMDRSGRSPQGPLRAFISLWLCGGGLETDGREPLTLFVAHDPLVTGFE